MISETAILAGTAASLGLVHTILGPDHYLPFIVLARSRQWSRFKTAMITFVCGLGHILSSVILGIVGIFLGIAVFKLEAIESWRGEVAGWFLIAFGITYFIWGVHRAIRNKPHAHAHFHSNGEQHIHTHTHDGNHTHIHEHPNDHFTPWILFLIFVFGPCEPLIPLLIYPAAQHNFLSVALVAAVFGIATIATMMAIVLISVQGLSRFRWAGMERFSHAVAGLTIFLCGGAIKFLGL